MITPVFLQEGWKANTELAENLQLRGHEYALHLRSDYRI
jgi:hypothetical protein